MSFTTPLFIPLVEGLDLSKDATLGDKELALAENIDFSVQGQVRGRPGRAAASQFSVRTTSLAYAADQAFAATGFRPNGLMRLKDGTDERAMLGTDGRLFALEGSTWRDRGAFACMKVDQPITYFTQPPGSTLVRRAMGPDFGTNVYSSTIAAPVSLYSPTTLGFERAPGTTYDAGSPGTMARCGTTTATVYVQTFTNNLFLLTRANGATTLTATNIATDAASCSNNGDAPVICCDYDETAFFVIYQTTTANQYKVKRVSTAGSVIATYTGTLTGIHGHWVSNSLVADNRVVIGLTGPDGLTVKVLNATTMADLTLDSTNGAVNCDAREVVVGIDTSARAWFAYRIADDLGAATNIKGLRVGTVNPGSAASATVVKTYSSQDSTGGALGVATYTPMHAPLKLGGRMYLTVGTVTDSSWTTAIGVWFTLDLTNLISGSGGFDAPTLAARGRTDATALRVTHLQPEGAVLLSDGTGWTFPSHQWSAYDVGADATAEGQQAVTVLNRVRLSQPRSVIAGDATIFSGSVPRTLAGGQCYEMGFPHVRPTMQTNPNPAGGSLAAGSYTIYTCWTYVDGAGQVHRSAVSALEQTTAGATSLIEVYVQTPYFTERPAGTVKFEVYCTGVNPATGDPAYLQSVVTPSTSAGATKYEILTVTTGTLGVYTLDGEFAHVTPQADGGIAALGRRVWLADRNTVYASLLMTPGDGVAWNDEGSLQVNLPAGAGRIVALEGLDDKLAIFCERGVYMVQDGGPDNTGSGPDIQFPVRLTDLGCAGPRSTCVTDRGVVFCSPLDSTDPQRGGPWLLDRSLSLTERKYLGSPALDYFLGDGSWVPEVDFSYERQQAYVTVPTANSNGDSGVVVIDMRMSKWSTWAHDEATQGALRSIAVVSGKLWSLGTEPAGYTATPGSDAEGDYAMTLATSHFAANGTDGLGWARVRSITPLGSASVITMGGTVAHDLTISAVQDQVRLSSSGTIAIVQPGIGTGWPSNRSAPEWRLPVQKCSSLQVVLSATPAVARWSAIRLDVQPLAAKAPANQRI